MAQGLAGLDTDVLLALQAGAPEFVEAHRLLSEARYLFIATPTVAKELEVACGKKSAEFTSALAENILAQPTRLGLVMHSARAFNDTQGEVADIHVDRVIERKVISSKSRGELTAIMEAAYLDCMLFVTTNQEVLSKRKALEAALIECGMNSIYMFSPPEIVEFFPGR